LGNCKRRGPYRGESDAEAKRRTRRRTKTKHAKSDGPSSSGELPWRQWYTTWAQTSRSFEEFWDLSPAQVGAIFEGMGYMKQKAGHGDVMQFAKSLGLNVPQK
jgi:hypothetical protein